MPPLSMNVRTVRELSRQGCLLPSLETCLIPESRSRMRNQGPNLCTHLDLNVFTYIHTHRFRNVTKKFFESMSSQKLLLISESVVHFIIFTTHWILTEVPYYLGFKIFDFLGFWYVFGFSPVPLLYPNQPKLVTLPQPAESEDHRACFLSFFLWAFPGVRGMLGLPVSLCELEQEHWYDVYRSHATTCPNCLPT